jgi:hypothetical protein
VSVGHQLFDDVGPDEAGRPGDEVPHRPSPRCPVAIVRSSE